MKTRVFAALFFVLMAISSDGIMKELYEVAASAAFILALFHPKMRDDA